MTPEFGPDGYQAINPTNMEAIGNLWNINSWMGKKQNKNFEKFLLEYQA